MAVPFRDDAAVDDLDGLGSAGYFKIERSADGAGWLGALFVIDARGSPLEFAYNRVTVPRAYLWRESDLRRYVERRLVASLLSVCTHLPRLLLCRADEAGGELFRQDILVELPVGLVREAPTSQVDLRTGEVLEDAEVELPDVVWQSSTPDQGSVEQRLFHHLCTHGLLHEPFERASIGLREAYAVSTTGRP